MATNTEAKPFLNSPKSLTSKQLGAYIAIGSLTMLFGTWVLSYLLAYVRAKVWPPIGEEPLPVLGPSLSLAIVIVSSVLIHTAFKAYVAGKFKTFSTRWLSGIILGFAFLISQYSVWLKLVDLGIRAHKSLWGSMVFGMIGIHAFHVVLALPALVWVFVSVKSAEERFVERVQIVGWFWHFLGILWAILYTCLVWL